MKKQNLHQRGEEKRTTLQPFARFPEIDAATDAKTSQNARFLIDYENEHPSAAVCSLCYDSALRGASGREGGS